MDKIIQAIAMKMEKELIKICFWHFTILLKVPMKVVMMLILGQDCFMNKEKQLKKTRIKPNNPLR